MGVCGGGIGTCGPQGHLGYDKEDPRFGAKDHDHEEGEACCESCKKGGPCQSCG